MLPNNVLASWNNAVDPLDVMCLHKPADARVRNAVNGAAVDSYVRWRRLVDSSLSGGRKPQSVKVAGRLARKLRPRQTVRMRRTTA